MDGKGKSRHLEEGAKEGRRKDDKKKPGEKSATKLTAKLTLSEEMEETGHLSNRYNQREVPPRFLLQKQAKISQKFTTKNCQAVTKKPSKDTTTRWTPDTHTHTPSQDHAHSISTAGPRSDGGWSTGHPAKGSGWRKSNPESSNEWGQSTWDDGGAGGWAEGEGRGNKTEADGWSHNGHTTEGGWVSDDGSSRSQSPGGIVMVVKQTTPSKENSGPWESRTTSANWKMHTLDTKPVDENEKIREKVSWNKQESCETDSASHREIVTEGGNDGNVTTTTKMPFSREMDSSPTKTPSQTNMSGTSTPTQELGGVWRSGRTSANSVSSRSASPRKMNRGYDQTTSTSSTNSLSRGAGAGLILPRPRKSLAELEGGLESLHSAPSGWGDLPSPRTTDDTDKGTEYWGVPPDDMARLGQPPIINGWNGGSHSPHPKSGEYPSDSTNWSSNENAGKAGWAEEKLPHPEPTNYYESGKMTSSASEPHLSHSHSGGLDMPPTHTEPSSYTIKTKWNSFDDTKEPAAFQPVYPNPQSQQSQMIQNNIMVKDLLLRSQAVAKLQMGQPSGNIQSIQKLLSQQLNQAQIVRQKLLSQAPPTGISTLPPQHPLKVQVGRTNDIISQLKQQSQQVLSQQSTSIFNPRMKQQSHTHFAEGNGDLTYGLRDMSISQRSHNTTQQPRSMSKLQRLISNQEDGADNMYGGNHPSSSAYNSTSPFSPPFRSSSTNSMMSPSLAPKPVHQIQEFRPGVPWQPPRKNEGLSKHAEQYYNPPGPQRTLSQSTSSFGQQQQNRFGGQQQKFSRSLSTDTNYYGNPSIRGDHPWGNTAVDSRPQQTYNAGRGWNGPQRPGRISLPSTPVSSLPEHGGWRQQPPPSTLLPNQYTSRRGSRTPMDTHSEWIPDTPTSADPVWGVDGGAWPKSGGSGRGGWSQPETPSSERAWPESGFSEWQTSGKKMGAALSPWLVIRTNSPQLNIQSLKDTCKGFGDIKSFIEGPEFVLVGYGSVEETLQAKSHIDGLWGGKTSTEVVADGEMEKLWQQINEPPKPRPPPSSLLSDAGPRPGVFKWEDPKQAPPHSYSRQASTPGGSSVWSDGGFLSGISSPWSSEFSGTLASPSTGYQSDDIPSTLVTPDDRSQGNSVLSPFLPNGLL